MTRELRLQYDLDGYDYRAASAVLRWQSYPAWTRFAFGIYLMVIATVTVATVGASRAGRPLPSSLPTIVLIVGVLALFVISALARKRMWRTLAEGRLRKGPTQLTTDDDGVTVETPLSRTTIRWAAILDVIPGPDGLLLLVGGLECFSVPARAFPDAVAQAEALTFLRRRVAAAGDSHD